MMELFSFNSNLDETEQAHEKTLQDNKEVFYIARVGQIGKPLVEPYTATNSYKIVTDNYDLDFQRVHSAWATGYFEYWAVGSCQQFIRKMDADRVIARLNNLEDLDIQKAASLRALIEVEREKMVTLQLMMSTLEYKIIKKLK